MSLDQSVTLPSGGTVGFADYGHPDDPAVLWCHDGPGSRLDPGYVAESARAAGLAVTDRLDIGSFATIDISTGGAYALAVAALAPERVLGVVPCCALTDLPTRALGRP